MAKKRVGDHGVHNSFFRILKYLARWLLFLSIIDIPFSQHSEKQFPCVIKKQDGADQDGG